MKKFQGLVAGLSMLTILTVSGCGQVTSTKAPTTAPSQSATASVAGPSKVVSDNTTQTKAKAKPAVAKKVTSSTPTTTVTTVTEQASENSATSANVVKSVVATKPAAQKVVQVSTQPKAPSVVQTLKQQTVTPTSSTAKQPVTETPVYTDSANWSLGVVPGVQTSGKQQEQWGYEGSPQVTMKALLFQNGSNKFPIEGKVLTGYRKDVEVEIVPLNSNYQPIGDELWRYAVPVHSDGTFSGTVVLPFQSSNVDINIVFWNDDSTNLNVDYVASSWAANNQPSLSDVQLAMLSSWFVNYNDSSSIPSTARSIISSAGASGAMSEAKAITDWVSKNIAYDWNDMDNGQFFWQQSSDALTRRVGVCQDEAGLSAAMLRSLGVPTKVIMGDTIINGVDYPNDHSWIEFWNGSTWVTADPTWDQIYTQGDHTALPDSTTDDYFNPSASFFGQTHQNGHLFYW